MVDNQVCRLIDLEDDVLMQLHALLRSRTVVPAISPLLWLENKL
jgi:hypothetical protein